MKNQSLLLPSHGCPDCCELCRFLFNKNRPVTLTFSGVNFCSCVAFLGSGSDALSGGINAAFVLTLPPPPLPPPFGWPIGWGFYSPGVIPDTSYANVGCAGATTPYLDDLQIYFDCGVSIEMRVVLISQGVGQVWSLFYADLLPLPTLPLNSSGFTVANANPMTDCSGTSIILGPSGSQVGGYGGSVSVSW